MKILSGRWSGGRIAIHLLLRISMGVDELASVGKRSEFRLFYFNASEFLIDSRKSLQLVSRCFVAVASSLRGRRSQSPRNRFGDVFFFVQRELFPSSAFLHTSLAHRFHSPTPRRTWRSAQGL